MEFVSEHLFQLGDFNHEHSDDSDHEDLPFHGNHHCTHAPLAFVAFQSEEISLKEFHLIINYGTFVSPAPKGFSESPFQPPKG